jgi:hypothetical protein
MAIGVAIQRFVKEWKTARAETPKVTPAVVPLAFPSGATGPFDWRHETVVLGCVASGQGGALSQL